MKRNTKLMIIVGILIVVVIGASFAYYVATVGITGSGTNVGGTTERLIEVEYDAGTGNLATENMYPGKTIKKDFTVTVTPGSNTNEATYVIKLNITENTFLYCTDENYNEITNACEKGAKELIYTLKDSNGNIIATDDITGKTGEIELARETKTVSAKTIYTYTIEITYIETNKDQNHNTNKVVNGEVKVEFGEKGKTMKEILANSTINEGTPDFSKTAQKNCEGIEVPCEETNGIYKTQDDDGETYYYRGSVENNYVKFAGLYWRIIRINGDGSIRLIYDGTSAHQNGESTADSIVISNLKFNENNNDNAYVGLKYTIGELRGLSAKSNALSELETWYQNNLSSYTNKIDINAGFCGDRTPYADSEGTISGDGTGTTTTYYAGHIRLITNKSPVLTCTNNSDLYTVSSSNKGNKSLTYSIGMITADEISMSGGVWGVDNQSYYLYNGQSYWSLSPRSLLSNECGIFNVRTTGFLSGPDVNNDTVGVRPVINLKANTLFNTDSDGTITNPYIVL